MRSSNKYHIPNKIRNFSSVEVTLHIKSLQFPEQKLYRLLCRFDTLPSFTPTLWLESRPVSQITLVNSQDTSNLCH